MSTTSPNPTVPGGKTARLTGLLVLLLGGLALVAPLIQGKGSAYLLGLVLLVTALLRFRQTYPAGEHRGWLARAIHDWAAVVAGVLLFAAPSLVFTGLALLLGLSWAIEGVAAVAAAWRGRGEAEWFWEMVDGLLNILIGVLIAVQWPVTGMWSLAIAVALHNVSAGWAVVLGRQPVGPADAAEDRHPDPRLDLPPHPEFARLGALSEQGEDQRRRSDRYWRWMFVLTFFAIHASRMSFDWNLVGLLSPALATLGDVLYSLLLAYLIVAPITAVWRFLTRPLERRAWRRYLARVDRGDPPSFFLGPVRWWLTGRLTAAARTRRARGSPTAAVGWGLQVGLPLAAIMIAFAPLWGISWFFDTETWSTAWYEAYAEERTDEWRAAMFQAVRQEYHERGVSDEDLFRVTPDGVTAARDFRFIVIADCGEGDESQHILRDQYLTLGADPAVKFMVVCSDVIYPSGAMRDYEPKFYLPFKGFTKPIYALPGNHDWYDALDAFAANFFEPDAARLSLRARREADLRLTTTTEARIERMIDDADRMRRYYGVKTGLQRGTFFEIHAAEFSLIAVDTGIMRQIDDDQYEWLKGALTRAKDNFKMVLLGHPLYAMGHYQATDEGFAAIHRLLREHEVEVVMGGDTHDFEFYREPYEVGGRRRTMHHFVNGGGGAYISLGAALDWPAKDPVDVCGFYPRADALKAKFDAQTPMLKRPFWWWIKRVNSWPAKTETMSAVFNNNRAPFFQSFMEVRVEGSHNPPRVRLLLYGDAGRLRWRDLELMGRVIPEGQTADDPVEFVVPLTPGGPARP